MEQYLENPWRGRGLNGFDLLPLSNPQEVAHLLQRCPAHAPTPLRNLPDLAAHFGIAQLWLKDERARMGLGSFKALGAAYAIARAAAATQADDLSQALRGHVYVTASAGNHGMSVAAGARLFGARAVIVLADTVPEAFATRLRAKGAEVMRAGQRLRRQHESGGTGRTRQGLDAAVGQFMARLYRSALAGDGRLSATGRRGGGTN